LIPGWNPGTGQNPTLGIQELVRHLEP